LRLVLNHVDRRAQESEQAAADCEPLKITNTGNGFERAVWVVKKVQRQSGLAGLFVVNITLSKLRRSRYRIDEPQLLGTSDRGEKDDEDDKRA
jgi:hypothetical protein